MWSQMLSRLGGVALVFIGSTESPALSESEDCESPESLAAAALFEASADLAAAARSARVLTRGGFFSRADFSAADLADFFSFTASGFAA